MEQLVAIITIMANFHVELLIAVRVIHKVNLKLYAPRVTLWTKLKTIAYPLKLPYVIWILLN